MATGRKTVASTALFTRTTWQLVAFGAPENPHTADPASGAMLAFDSDGTFMGSTGCNHLRGRYDIAGEILTCGPFYISRRACTHDELTTQEQAILQALGLPLRCELSDRHLSLYYDQYVLLFRAI